MSVTAAKGFQAAGIAAGIKENGNPDLALVVNTGPRRAAAGVFTSNRVKAAPVQWSEQVLKTGRLSAVVLNSGGANACTGPKGFQDTHATAEKAAEVLGTGAVEVAVCSTGLIGVLLPMDKLLPGIETAAAQLSEHGGEKAAIAIKTTDTVHKTSVVTKDGWTVGGMAKGAGMLAPGLATMLVVLTTDADLEAEALDRALRAATRVTFDRVDSDGCMSTNDTVLLLASGAAEVTPDFEEFADAVRAVCDDLGQQLIRDAEGASKDIKVEVVGRRDRGRTPWRWAVPSPANNLLKCAIPRRGPQLGPRPVRDRHHEGRLSSPTGSTSPSTACGCARTAASARTGRRSTCATARCTSSPTSPPGPRPPPSGPTTSPPTTSTRTAPTPH
ncbi:LOW QUALITY PROTEIN: ArgJ family protein, partial [Streptomyces sp. e14]